MTSSCDHDSSSNQMNEFSDRLSKLFSVNNVTNTSEAFVIFLHRCMLDIGFLPANVNQHEIDYCLPGEWQTEGAFRFLYSHRTCTNSFCHMTCVPLYAFMAVYGVLENESPDDVYFKFDTTEYVNEQTNLTNIENFFLNSKELQRTFKDQFCYPLLALLQERADCYPSFGFSVTVDDIKLYILKFLSVESITALSTVNKDFNRVANSSLLWKYLLERDFGLVDVPASSSEDGYKEMYKREYLKKRQRLRRPRPIADYLYPYRSIYPANPYIHVDPTRDLDPVLQQAFPNLRDRFRPNWLMHPYDYLGRFM